MVVSKTSVNIDFVGVDNYSFEKVDDFKYLGINIIIENDMRVEINKRIKGRNGCYYSIIELLKSKLLSGESKTMIFTSAFFYTLELGTQDTE